MSHCEHCPVSPGRRCASESHSRFCDLVAKEGDRPGYWSDSVAKKSASLEGTPCPVSRRPFPPTSIPDGRIRAVWIEPGAFLGGAEIHTEMVMGHCDPARIRWDRIAIRHQPDVPAIPTVLDAWGKHCPIRVGDASIRQAASEADVILTWGIRSDHLEPMIPADVPVIEISHCAFETEAAQSQCAMPRSHLVAVARTALKGIPPGRRDSAAIIHNAVSADRVKPLRSRAEIRREWGVPEDAKVVGWLARLSKDKAPEPWIDGIARLPGNWWGVMVGAGMEGGWIRDHAAKVAPRRIVLPGPTSDVGSALGAFDCMVMTSPSEGCCYAIAEAWRARVPVISTRVGLLEEWPELARILPEKPTGQDVAVAILRDWKDPEGTAARVARAEAFAADRLSMESFGRAWTDLICSVAAPAPIPEARATRPSLGAAIRDRVVNCPDRGPVLPISMQDDCGCKGKELSECRSGKGKNPGRVTLRDCLACQAR